MFGIAKPCRHSIGPALHREWMAHLCGLCLSLRDHHGQAARATTNVDAVLLSVLVEAQRAGAPVRVEAGRCALRGMRTQAVVGADDSAARHAAAVSLTMAATKLDDHALDGDGLPGRLPAASRAVARRWAAAGGTDADAVGFDAATLRRAAEASAGLERRPGLGFDAYVAPTEDAAAAAFAHTAVLAGRPGNQGALDRLGRAFGRITYLLDAVEDADDDLAHGRFNALVAERPDPVDRRAAARVLFRDAFGEVLAAFDALELERAELARAVVVDQVRRAGHARLHVQHDASCTVGAGTGHHRHGVRPVRVLAGVGVAALGAVGLSAAIFRPEDVPPEQLTEDELRRRAFEQAQAQQGQQPPGTDQGSGFGEDAVDAAADGCCDACECCCCSMACCDCCTDCDCCCDC